MRKELGFSLMTVFATLAVATTATAEGAIGHVSSANGTVSARGADGSTRSLGCGDAVFAGDTLSTGSAGSVGVLMGDVLAQVAPQSTLAMGRTPGGAPDAQLSAGRVRVIDARDEGAPLRLAAGGAESRVVGTDTEAYVLSEKVGNYAMFCEWDEPLAVRRDGQQATADPGHCVIAKPQEPLYTSRAHDDRIPAAGADACPPNLGTLASTGPHFSALADRGVSSGPGGGPIWGGPAPGIGVVPINPCDDPGATCAAGAVASLSALEPPISTDPQPGAPGPLPGMPVMALEPPISVDPQPGGAAGPLPGAGGPLF